ncbi:MAG: NeuD/PglB/VioB family sugar acetyltransferase [Bacteroidetes bacterium]|nr:NeuD/PglB/VioB family sugar acetyltransferase [Bacteroidota bacterium]
MKNIIIVGAGALGQELAWLIEEINDNNPEWNILGFLDDFAFDNKKSILGYPVLGRYDDYLSFMDSFFVVGFGDAVLREKIIRKMNSEELKWANLISPTVRVHRSNKIGKGVVIGRYTDLTVNCTIHDFVMLNIHVVLGHEVSVGQFSIISPNVTVNGGGRIGKACQIGANSFIRDIEVGDYSVVGASSCVIKNVDPESIVAGVPAKVLKVGRPNTSISRSEREDAQ